jgi:putative membrane protein insertion efficiency factor
MIAEARSAAASLPTLLAKGVVRLYRATLSPLATGRCRFYPRSSAYALECLDLYPFHVAARKIAGRLARCHPLHPGGLDFP